MITSPAAAIRFYTGTICHGNAYPVHALEDWKALHDALPTPYSNMPFHIYNASFSFSFFPSPSPSSSLHPFYSLTFATGAQAFVFGFVLYHQLN